MISKRTFLKSALISLLSPKLLKAAAVNTSALHEPKTDGEFWLQVAKDYESKAGIINLENGYYSIMSKPVMKGYVKDIMHINKEGSYYMRTIQFENKFKTRDRLAKLIGCNQDELIITRNTTESMNTIISGLDWKPGDEAVMAWQDYGSMLDMFKQQQNRFGIKCVYVSVPQNPQNDEDIVSVYKRAITPKTKLLMICHMINITGQILPVKKICEMAHQAGVEVLVDGAHAFAHIDFNLTDLGCDYYGCSLHKWLGAPLGAGILYVKKEKIKKIWPLFAEYNFADDDIRKLNHTGTNPVAVDVAINHAINYHQKIGIKRKEQRLRFLQQYWLNQVKKINNVYINTPNKTDLSCAIANIGIQGISPANLAQTLLTKYNIYTVAIDNEKAGVKGVRVTPHVYTQTADLDKLVQAIKEISGS